MIATSSLPRSSPISNPLSRAAQQQRSLRFACLAAKTLDDYRGDDTLVLDLTGITPIADYFVVSTASSMRQMKSMVEEVKRILKSEGSPPLGTEGLEGGGWILQDFGDIVVHVFTAESREMYDLEHLWADAPHVDWKSPDGLGDASASA